MYNQSVLLQNRKVNRINIEFITLFLFYATTLVDIFRNINYTIYVEIFRNVIYIIVFIYVLKDAVVNNFLLFIVIAIGFASILLISYLLNPEIKTLIPQTVLLFYSRCLCGIYIGYYLTKYDQLITALQKYSFISIIYIITFYKNDYIENYMPFSYNLMLPLLSLVIGIFINKKKYQIVPALILFMMILVKGARGPLMWFLAFCAMLFFLQYIKMSHTKKLISILTIIFSALILLLLYFRLIKVIDIDYSDSRTLFLLSQGQLFDSGGRDIFYLTSLKNLAEYPFKIRGILYDRVLMSTALNTEILPGNYAHNIILEILLQFGLVIGSIIVMGGLYIIFKSFRYIINYGEDSVQSVFCIFTSYLFTTLMVSQSYLTDYLFWFYCGFLLRIYYSYKIQKGINTYEAKIIT